ncbi:MAG: hypothetical protein ACM30G_07140 [Micromonosporaceae bacterium]
MSLTALALNVTPGALAPGGFNGPVKTLAMVTMLVFAAGTALFELLHRSALRAGREIEQPRPQYRTRDRREPGGQRAMRRSPHQKRVSDQEGAGS